MCGDQDQAGTYFGGWTGPVAPISCPDNIAFDSVGNLWIATDPDYVGAGKRPDRGHWRGPRPSVVQVTRR